MPHAKPVAAFEGAPTVGVFQQRRHQRDGAVAGLAHFAGTAGTLCRGSAPPGRRRPMPSRAQGAGSPGAMRDGRPHGRERPSGIDEPFLRLPHRDLRQRQSSAGPPATRACQTWCRHSGKTSARSPSFSASRASHRSHCAAASVISAQTAQDGRCRKRRRIRRTGSGSSANSRRHLPAPPSPAARADPRIVRMARSAVTSRLATARRDQRGSRQVSARARLWPARTSPSRPPSRYPASRGRCGMQTMAGIAVAIRPAGAEQQAEKKALAAFDVARLGAGRARPGIGDQRRGPLAGGRSTRQARQRLVGSDRDRSARPSR